MQGKTPAEVTVLARQLADVAARSVQQPQYQQPPQPQYGQPQNQQPAPDPGDYVQYSALQNMGTQYLQQAGQLAQQYANPAIENMANMALDRVKERQQRAFAKYGPEIYPLLSRIPKTDWSIDNLTQAVDLVRSRHLDEEINDRAGVLAAQDPALRSSGAPGSTAPTPSNPADGLTDFQKDALRRRGLTPEVVAEFCAKKGGDMTPAKWYELYGKSAIGDAL
jgi:hypothetical protein